MFRKINAGQKKWKYLCLELFHTQGSRKLFVSLPILQKEEN